MHILIAPNAFKNSLDAENTAYAIGNGLQQSRLDCTFEYFPVGDGGDGTASLLIKKLHGVTVNVKVHDPLGRLIDSRFGLIENENIAVIEMADASGLRLLRPDELDPVRANSFGTGELICRALDHNVKKIILGIGGSATVDGGTGIAQSLGIRFLDSNGKELAELPKGLLHLHAIDFSKLDKRILNCELIILCDVQNLLLGEEGAAKIFGPQKGASPGQVEMLEAALGNLNDTILKETGINISTVKHGGAAGGTAAGLYGLLNATLKNGIDYFLEITGFNQSLERADLVITGEGSIDAQTLQGKAPFGVAVRAKQKGIKVIGLAGQVPLEKNDAIQSYFDILMPIGHAPMTVETAMLYTSQNLVRTARELGNAMELKT